MKVAIEINTFYDLKQFCWSGALTTLDQVENKGLENELMDLLNEVFNENIEGIRDDVELNDFIWFDLENYEPFDKLWEEDEEDEEEDEV